jgi:hypothetical protein
MTNRIIARLKKKAANSVFDNIENHIEHGSWINVFDEILYELRKAGYPNPDKSEAKIVVEYMKEELREDLASARAENDEDLIETNSYYIRNAVKRFMDEQEQLIRDREEDEE